MEKCKVYTIEYASSFHNEASVESEINNEIKKGWKVKHISTNTYSKYQNYFDRSMVTVIYEKEEETKPTID